MVTYIYLLDNEKKPINSIPSGTSTGIDIAEDLAKVYIERWMDVPMGRRDLEKELWRLKVIDNLNGMPEDMKEYLEGIPNDKIPYYDIQERIDTKFMELYQGLGESKKGMPDISSEEIEADLPKYLEGVLKTYKELGQIGAGVIIVNDLYLIRFSQNF